MQEWISQFFNSNFMPHGHCYFWTPSILWLHVGSDAMIAASYVSIAISLGVFSLQKRTHFSWLFWMFSGFILLCGLTHLMAILTTWNPQYGAEGVVKGATAIISAITAIALWPMLPKVLALPSQKDIEDAHNRLKEFATNLEEKVKIRTQELEERNHELEVLNKARAVREERIIELKKQVNELKIRLGHEPEFTEHDE